MDMTPQAWPDWYDGRHINEVLFCQQFLDKHPMKCVRGRLFTVDGLIEDEGQIGNHGRKSEQICGTANFSPQSAHSSLTQKPISRKMEVKIDEIQSEK